MLGDRNLAVRTLVIPNASLATTGDILTVPPIAVAENKLIEAPTYAVVGIGIVATAAISDAVLTVQEIKADGTVGASASVTVNVTSANVGTPIALPLPSIVQCDKGSGFRVRVTTAGGAGAAAHVAVHYVTSEEDLPLEVMTVTPQTL